MATATTKQCSRCGASDHLAAECKKPFTRPLCSHCNRLGHMTTDCPQLRRCLFCNTAGHLARNCPEKIAKASMKVAEVSSASSASSLAMPKVKANGTQVADQMSAR